MPIGLNKTLDGKWEVARESLRADLITIETFMNQIRFTTKGTLSAVAGGTGLSSFVVGDLLYANSTTTLARLADIATGNALISGGVGVAPSWGKIGLTTHVSGTLPIANGGTNITTYTLGDLLYASAANVLSKLAGNTTATRNFLRQTGTGAVSAAPVWDTIVNADIPGAAFTKTDDTNVTATLTGTPTTAVLRAMNVALGWTGQLSVPRGGSGAATLTGVLLGNGASAFTAVALPADATKFLDGTGAFSTPTSGGSPLPYDPGASVTIATGKFLIMANHLILTGVERLTVQGTGRFSLIT
jgi:hypothetical protein